LKEQKSKLMLYFNTSNRVNPDYEIKVGDWKLFI
jgi:hypothetical protein